MLAIKLLVVVIGMILFAVVILNNISDNRGSVGPASFALIDDFVGCPDAEIESKAIGLAVERDFSAA